MTKNQFTCEKIIPDKELLTACQVAKSNLLGKKNFKKRKKNSNQPQKKVSRDLHRF